MYTRAMEEAAMRHQSSTKHGNLRLVVLVLVAVCLLGESALCETRRVEVEVPAFTGTYVGTYRDVETVIAEVAIPVPSSVEAMFVRLVGTAVPGLAMCPEPVELGMSFDFWYSDPVQGTLEPGGSTSTWSMTDFDFQEEVGNLSVTAGLADFVLAGGGHFEMHAHRPMSTCFVPNPMPEVTLTNVYFVVVGDYPVAEGAPSWGGVKALFR